MSDIDPKSKQAWKAAFLKSLEKAAADLGEVSEQQISQEIARHRKSRKKLKMLVETPKKTA